MTFGEFNKLACGDRVTLISAIDTLMQAGQTYIRGTEIAEIISELKKAVEISLLSRCSKGLPKSPRIWPNYGPARCWPMSSAAASTFAVPTRRVPESVPSAAVSWTMICRWRWRMETTLTGPVRTAALRGRKAFNGYLPRIMTYAMGTGSLFRSPTIDLTVLYVK